MLNVGNLHCISSFWFFCCFSLFNDFHLTLLCFLFYFVGSLLMSRLVQLPAFVCFYVIDCPALFRFTCPLTSHCSPCVFGLVPCLLSVRLCSLLDSLSAFLDYWLVFVFVICTSACSLSCCLLVFDFCYHLYFVP